MKHNQYLLEGYCIQVLYAHDHLEHVDCIGDYIISLPQIEHKSSSSLSHPCEPMHSQAHPHHHAGLHAWAFDPPPYPHTHEPQDFRSHPHLHAIVMLTFLLVLMLLMNVEFYQKHSWLFYFQQTKKMKKVSKKMVKINKRRKGKTKGAPQEKDRHKNCGF